MPSFVMRIWLADRPGALGEVARTIGSVGGDLVGIDILERGDGRAIDELTVELPGDEAVPRLLKAIGALRDVDVEDLRGVIGGLPHPLIDPLEVAASLLGTNSVSELFAALVAGVSSGFSSWAAIVDPDGPVVLDTSPGSPALPWLEAFVTGTRSAMRERGSAASANDVAWAVLDVSGLALLAGRSGRPFRARERRQLATIARIADHRWHELVTLEGMRAHPARFG